MSLGRSLEILFEKRKHFLPPVDGLGLSIAGTMMVKEPMTCIWIPVEFVRFPVFLQFRFVLVDLIWGRTVVLVSEDAQDRAREVCGVIERANRVFRR